jgi:hypothetical protein
MFRKRYLQRVTINSGCSYEFPADVIFISDDGARIYTENENAEQRFLLSFNVNDRTHISPWFINTPRARVCCFEQRNGEWISTCSSDTRKIILY